MKSLRCCALIALCCGCLVSVDVAFGQIVINEIVKEEQGGGGAAVNPDVREFVELYNAGDTLVDISGWSIVGYDLALAFDSFAYTLPSGATIGPGDYYVIGGSVVPNVDFVPGGGAGTDLFPDLQANALLLRDDSNTLIDGAGYDVYRTGTSGLSLADPAVVAEIGNGYHGRLVSLNSAAPISPSSMSRYEDGRDSNRNGYDFGFLPLTPGASNNSTFMEEHSVPNVDGLAVGAALGTEYNASFTLPKVIDPMVADANNPRALPTQSPQGGKAMIAWDPSGGGNAVYSRELTNKFDIYAYFDTAPLGVAVETADEEWESTAYGIGSTDPYFNHPDPSGGIFVPTFTTQNGSTGIGWVFQNYEDGTNTQPGFTQLMLVDFGDGGENKPDSGEWTIIETIDMTTVASDWYRLGIDYSPETGEVSAWFDDQTFSFTTETDLLGNFFVGYREAITGAVSARLDKHSPPTFDLFVAAPSVPGDYDGDGDVDSNDYTTWKNAFGDSVAAGSGADGNGDGIVNAADYTVWRDNLGASGSGGASVGAVPEPSSLFLATAAIGGFALRRRRRNGPLWVDSTALNLGGRDLEQ